MSALSERVGGSTSCLLGCLLALLGLASRPSSKIQVLFDGTLGRRRTAVMKLRPLQLVY